METKEEKKEDMKKQLTRRVQEEEEAALGTRDALGVMRKKDLQGRGPQEDGARGRPEEQAEKGIRIVL